MDTPTDSNIPMDALDLKQPDFYINRELSLLAFNQRVLAQSLLEQVPLLERLRYLCISCTNLDEFFEVRVASVKQQAEVRTTSMTADGLTPSDNLRAISQHTHELVDKQYLALNDILIPALEAEGVNFIRRSDFTPAQEKWVREYFQEELFPILTPIGLDPAHPFPRVINKGLTFIVSLKGKDAFGRTSGMAIVQAPRALPRIIQLPQEESGSGPHDFVFLSSIIHAYVDELFPGMKITGCYQFRLTRNSDLFVDEEEVDDLLRALEGELMQRRYGDAVRLEVAHDCPDGLVEFLRQEFALEQDDIYQVNGPVNLNRLSAVCDIVDRPDLKFNPFTPSIPTILEGADLFSVIQKQDILLHHPFESFLPVVDFLLQAAKDPNVLAIKQTLYRSGPDSAIVNALVKAAEAGKEVTVVIELRARFDEAENIALANKLQKAGAQVVYGVVGFKTHAKMVLVIRREGKKMCRYVHLGTGNYHARTARLYTDYGLLTSDKTISSDVQQVFMQLTSPGKTPTLHKLLQSPFTLHEELWKKIAREEENARAGKPARIIAKMNSLVEPKTIRALYRASMAGVKISLIIRGICCLRPGIEGVSDNIQVISIIGQFLEHPRVFYFENDDHDSEIYASSADWMDRNLFRRVEIAFPIENKKIRQRMIEELNYYLEDNTQAWALQQDGQYQHINVAEGGFSAQRYLLEKLAG